jgi:ribose transport system permease protein
VNASTKLRETGASPPAATAADSEGPPATLRHGLLGRIRRQAGRSAIWIVLVDLICIGAFAAINSAFVSGVNLTNLALSGTEVVLLAVAEALLLTAGEFDISLGANLVLSSVVGSQLLVNLSGSSQQVQSNLYPHIALGTAVGIVGCLLTGCAMGAFNGFVVTKMRVNSLITTLATFGIATGIADILTNGANVAYMPSSVQLDFGIKNVAGVPLPTLVIAVVVLVTWWVLAKTRFGLHTTALGSSREACERAGLRVHRQIVWLFVLAGFLAGLAGLIDASRFATTDVGGHQTDALAAIAGAVIGGTALYGGQGSIGGAVAGAMLSVVLTSGLVIAGLSPFYQYIAIGTVLILAVFLDQRKKSLT